MPKSLHVVRLGESCVVHLIPGTKTHLWVLWYRYCSKNHFLSGDIGSEPISCGKLRSRAGGQSQPQLNNGMHSYTSHVATQIISVT